MAPSDQLLVVAHGQIMLLDSFVNQAVRHALAKLDLRTRLGRAYERVHKAGTSSSSSLAEVEKLYDELAGLQPKLQSTFDIVDMLRTRTKANEPSESLRVRSRILDFLRACFSDILGSPVAPKRTVRPSNVPDHCAAIRSPIVKKHDSAMSSAEDHYIWSLIRPVELPRVLVEMFLLLSAQISHIQVKNRDPTEPLMVGELWYCLLGDLLGQLGLSAYQFGEYSPKQVLSAFEHVSPAESNRTVLYPSLWQSVNSDHIAHFDSNWTSLRSLVGSLEDSRTRLLRRCSPHYFGDCLSKYLSAAVSYLDPPTLDLYNDIRQTGSIPPGFFAIPDRIESLPPRPLLLPHGSDNDIDISVTSCAEQQSDTMPGPPSTAPRSAYAPCAAASSVTPMMANTSLARHTSEGSQLRLALPNAFTPISSRQVSQIDAGNVSEPSDVEMSPSHHAYVKRQKSSESTLNATPARMVPQLEQGSRINMSMLDDENVDMDNTVVATSPSALLSARHNKRVRDSVQSARGPPILDLASVSDSVIENRATTVSADSEGANAQSPDGPLALSDSAMTTPKSQTGENSKIEKPKYVSGWMQGDVEGGGRPHRRRHDAGAFGTPGSAPDVTHRPPPQTVLSPRNIAAVQLASGTPERGKSSIEHLLPPQVTPEHQTGPAADAGARSASRYVVRKEEGDTEGGGRKHRKRLRSGLELSHSGL
ncbi:hypothetical protein IWW37_001809 [Coemansia sp. RSA 2050]|nr:hypothetical protein IWW37_001809 [Coemansia sp. RSA 2050]KAJ2729077.1 hypothetical protein IW152_005749 [Coemansia sp. BCRC 34962]